MKKILKTLCYRQVAKDLYVKTIANTYLCLNLKKDKAVLAQMFMGADNQLLIWSRKEGEFNNIADLVALECDVIRPNGFNTVINDFDSFFPPLSQQEMIEILLH